MKTVEEYRRHVEECRELAKRAQSPDDRKAILAIAMSWHKLAGDRERRLSKHGSTDTTK
jgi:hypothetical protein